MAEGVLVCKEGEIADGAPLLRDRVVQGDRRLHGQPGAAQALYQGMARGGITSADGSYQELAGRITRYPLRKTESVPPPRTATSR